MSTLFSGIVLGVLTVVTAAAAADSPTPASPTVVVATSDGQTLYVVCRERSEIAVLDVASSHVVETFATAPHPTSLAVSRDGATLWVTSGVGEGKLEEFEVPRRTRRRSVAAGHSPTAISLTHDGTRLVVCNRFAGTVREFETRTLDVVATHRVGREPVATAITSDDALVFVACAMPSAPLYDQLNFTHRVESSSDVFCIDRATGEVKPIRLPNGSHSLRAMTISPDGYHLYVTGNIGRFHSPTERVERGWINTNTLHIIDVTSRQYFNSLLLDEVSRGAADPVGVACTPDGKKIVVALGGTHELLVIENDTLWERLLRLPYDTPGRTTMAYWGHDTARMTSEVPNDLAFLDKCRDRIPLVGQGGCGVAIVNNNAFVAMQFSDNVNGISLTTRDVSTIEMSPRVAPDARRRGEAAWHDATLARESWLSCATCHPDARTDGLAWDLLNDGVGNTKAVKSLLNAHRTPPAMWHGVRASAAVAIRTGFQFIEFSDPDESICRDIEVYLASLTPVPSPFLVDGKRSAAAERGKVLFETKLGCALCHPASLFTDLRKHDVGSHRPGDRSDGFDTPSLLEVWRTAPYLHDGRAKTLAELFTDDRFAPLHGDTAGNVGRLAESEVTDLVEYLLSL